MLKNFNFFNEDEAAVAEVCDDNPIPEVTDAEAEELIKGQEAVDRSLPLWKERLHITLWISSRKP